MISSGSVDGARSASATLDWLDAHGHQDMVRNSIAVINAVRPRSGKVDMQKVVDHFARRCRAVRQVPFDPHLEEGAEISLERLKPETREALLELAAVVAEGFPGARSDPATCLKARAATDGVCDPRAEPAQEIRVVVRADRARPRAGRGQPRQPPAGIDQAGQDEREEQIRHAENLLDLNIRAVGRLGPCLTAGPDPASWLTCWPMSWPACCSSSS